MSDCEEGGEPFFHDEGFEGTQVGVNVDGANVVIKRGKGEELAPVKLADLRDKMHRRGEYCWGCVNLDKASNPQDDPELWQLEVMYREAKGKMTNEEVLKRISEFFESSIAAPRRAEGMEVEPWPLDMIRTHYNVHRVGDALSTHYKLIEDQKVLLEYLNDCLFGRNKKGELVGIDKLLAHRDKAQERLYKQMRMNPSDLFNLS